MARLLQVPTVKVFIVIRFDVKGTLINFRYLPISPGVFRIVLSQFQKVHKDHRGIRGTQLEVKGVHVFTERA